MSAGLFLNPIGFIISARNAESAVALDAVLQARNKNIIKENDVVVSISTASGIKFPKSGIEHHLKGGKKNYANPLKVVNGTIEEIEKVVGF